MRKEVIQFVEIEKTLKKGVDKKGKVWYYKQAVARESEKQEKTAVDRDRKASNDTKLDFMFFSF